MNPPEIRAALDTSVVMRLLTGHPLDLATAARDYMADIDQSGAKVFVSNVVVMETYFACQHHYGMPKAAVLSGLHTLFSMSIFVIHPLLIGLVSIPDLASAKPGFLDRLIHAEAVVARMTLVTFEKAAARLPDTLLLKAPL